MALKKTDLLLLLTELQDSGIDVSVQIRSLMKSPTIPLDVIKFINDNRELEITKFYEHIRKTYNEKKSKLYINIMREVEEPQEALTTLSAMLNQIMLWNKNVENKQLFLDNSRAKEITLVLNNYLKTYDITQALTLIRLIKSDIKCLESATRE